MTKPNWSFWLNQADVRVIDAIVLSCNVDPHSIDESSNFVTVEQASLNLKVEHRGQRQTLTFGQDICALCVGESATRPTSSWPLLERGERVSLCHSIFQMNFLALRLGSLMHSPPQAKALRTNREIWILASAQAISGSYTRSV